MGQHFKVGDKVRLTTLEKVGEVIDVITKPVAPKGESDADYELYGYVVRLSDGSTATLFTELESYIEDESDNTADS